MRIPLQVQSLTISPHLQELQHTAENRVKLITPPQNSSALLAHPPRHGRSAQRLAGTLTEG